MRERVERIDTDERRTTTRMVRRYLTMLENEPAQDAGMHPSLPVHEQVGAAWADWDRQRRAWRTLIAPRLIAEALDDLQREDES